jgi:hypothetical protein
VTAPVSSGSRHTPVLNRNQQFAQGGRRLPGGLGDQYGTCPQSNAPVCDVSCR